MTHKIDPKIKVTDALNLTGGNQAKLAKMLGINRASVNEWVSSKRQYIPALQAYRFRELTRKSRV